MAVSIRVRLDWHNVSGQVPPGRIADHRVVDQRQPVPQLFEAVQEPDQLRIGEGLQAAILDQFDQMIKTHTELVQGQIHRRRLIADRPISPEVHDHILLEHVFDIKQISQ